MSGDESTGRENPMDVTGLPDSVTTLCDAMMKMNPNWSLMQWLDKCATEELELTASHLGREKLRLEQRLSRIDDIARYMDRLNEVNALHRQDPSQRNLIDVYDEENVVVESNPMPPVEFVGGNDVRLSDDDPMLAMISARILEMAEMADAEGSEFITWEAILSELIPSGLQEEEVDEAIAHLVQRAKIIEFKYGQFCLAMD